MVESSQIVLRFSIGSSRFRSRHQKGGFQVLMAGRIWPKPEWQLSNFPNPMRTLVAGGFLSSRTFQLSFTEQVGHDTRSLEKGNTPVPKGALCI